MDSWVAANGSNNHPKVGEPNFKDGFAPKCVTGQQWQFERGKWQCSGAVPWTQQVYFPDVTADDDSSTLEKAGFYILPYNVRTGNVPVTAPQSYQDATESSSTLEKVNALCWAGTESDKPGDLSTESDQWFSVEITGLNHQTKNPIPVFGQLDLSQTSSDKYTCEWHFTESNGNTFDDKGEGIQSLSKTEFKDACEARDWTVSGEKCVRDSSSEIGFNIDSKIPRGDTAMDTREEDGFVNTANQEWKSQATDGGQYSMGVTIPDFTE